MFFFQTGAAYSAEEELSDNTVSSERISEKDFEKIPSPVDAADFLTYVPGVETESSSSIMMKTIKIRGRTAVPPRIASSGIKLLIDGIPYNDPATGYADIYQIPSVNIEKIEILKGALSARYGTEASAGVVNIITRKGTLKPITDAKVSYGTYQRRRSAERELYENYSMFHGWGNKYFDYAISADYVHSSGFTTADKNRVGSAYTLFAKNNPGMGRFPDGTKVLPGGRREIPFKLGEDLNELIDVGDHDKSERYSVNLNLGFNLFKGNTLRIMPGYSYVDFYNVVSPGNMPLERPSAIFSQYLIRIKNRKDTLNISDRWEITPGLTYNFRAGLMKSTDMADAILVNDYIDYSPEEETINGLRDMFANGDPENPFSIIHDELINRSFSIANDLSYRSDIFDGNILTVGQEYRWTKSTSKSLGYLNPSEKRNIHSLFFNDLLYVKNFTLSLGGRWDQATTFIDDLDDEFSPRAGLNYEFSPGTSLRFSVGRARRFPGFTDKFAFAQSNGILFGNPDLKPEVNWTYEMGFKFSTKYVSGDIAYFYDDYSDIEIPVPLGFVGRDRNGVRYNGSTYSEEVLGISPEQQYRSGKNFANYTAYTFINGPDAVAQGFDTALQFTPLGKWDINVAYTFQRHVAGNPNPFDFSQGAPQRLFIAVNGTAIGPKFKDGSRMEFTPTHILKIGSNYTFPFGLWFDVEGRFKSTTHFVTAVYPGGSLRQPEHWIWDLKMAQPLFDGKMKLTFAIENIFSKFYYEDGGFPSAVARYIAGIETKF